MVDLHCHLIPGVDDGAVSLDVACEMAFQAWGTGTQAVVATPHFNRPDQSAELSVAQIKRRCRQTVERFREEGCPLELYYGMEMFVTRRLPWLLDRGEYITLGLSKYLLMEFYVDERYTNMGEMIQRVFDHGLIPMIAHPERYEAIQRHPERVEEWFGQGVAVQLNKGTIMGRMGNHCERTAWWLLKHGLAHAIASDAHSARVRNPNLDEVRRMLLREFPPDYVELLLEINPYHVIKDESLESAGTFN